MCPNTNTATQITRNIDESVASLLGTDAGMIAHRMRYWLYKNGKKGQNIRDGRVWTYDSLEVLNQAVAPWLKPSAFYRVIRKMELHGVLIRGNYNQTKFLKTTWYSLNDPQFELKPAREKPKTEQPSEKENRAVTPVAVDFSHPENRFSENEKCLHIKEPDERTLVSEVATLSRDDLLTNVSEKHRQLHEIFTTTELEEHAENYLDFCKDKRPSRSGFIRKLEAKHRQSLITLANRQAAADLAEAKLVKQRALQALTELTTDRIDHINMDIFRELYGKASSNDPYGDHYPEG